jgi:hypothetical protein
MSAAQRAGIVGELAHDEPFAGALGGEAAHVAVRRLAPEEPEALERESRRGRSGRTRSSTSRSSSVARDRSGHSRTASRAARREPLEEHALAEDRAAVAGRGTPRRRSR